MERTQYQLIPEGERPVWLKAITGTAYLILGFMALVAATVVVTLFTTMAEAYGW